MFNFTPQDSVGKSFELIPHNTLCWGILMMDPKEAIKNSRSGGRYLNFSLTVSEGPFEKKKIFERIGDPTHAGNSPEYKQMGIQALCRILETIGEFIPGDEASYAKYNNATIENIALLLDGKKVAFRVKLEPEANGYAAKNVVSEWLSPNPLSNGFKGYQQLTGALPLPAAVAAPKAAFAQPAKPAAPAAAPAWLGAQPAAQPVTQPA